MTSNKLLLITFIISVLIHLCVFIFIHTKPEEPKKEGEPIEVSVIEREKEKEEITPPPPAPEPAPTPYIPPRLEPEIEPEETTLDHDRPGGQKKGVEEKPIETPVLPTPMINEPVEKPAEELPEPELKDEEVTIERGRDLSAIWDTKEITERIAREKKALPEGQDTASYNAFEEKYASYFEKFRKRIYQQWSYPHAAAMRGENGVVRVVFSILKDGSVVNIRMVKSSGYPELDREVMRVLKNIGKIPLPESYELEQLNIDEANFIYIIGGSNPMFLE